MVKKFELVLLTFGRRWTDSATANTAGLLGSLGPILHRWTQMRDQTHSNKTLNNSPKTSLKHHKTCIRNKQRKAKQGTFGGRFDGRKSLQSRKSPTFGGRFGGRNSPPEPKVQTFGGEFRWPKLPPLAGSAAEPCFGGRTWILLGGRTQFCHPTSSLPKPSKLKLNTQNYA